MIKKYAGRSVKVDKNGFMTEPLQWNKEIAKEIAKEENITLSEMHFRIIEYLREKHLSGVMPTIRIINGSGITDLREFYTLFPDAPLKKACRIGGLPDPGSCV